MTRSSKLSFLNNALLLSILALAVSVYVYPILKPVPPGVDSSVYINDAHWMIEHRSIPVSNQITYHGSRAYPSPMTSLNLVLVHQVTGLDITYPVFSIYQLFLIILLMVSCYLVGSIYSRLMSFLFPIALLCSFSLIRLFIGSTISNLLAFSYINFVYYFVHEFFRTKKRGIVFLIVFFLAAIFLTHKYLTAPIFIPIFFLYIFLMITFDRSLKNSIFVFLRRIPKWLSLAIAASIITALYIGISSYIPVFNEARHAFWQTISKNKFQKSIPLSQYGSYLGVFVFNFGILGILAYIARLKRRVFSYLLLPLLWILVLVILLQGSYLGINFFYERIIFLSGVYIALFAAYGLSIFSFKKNPNHVIVVIVLGIFIFSSVVNGANQIKSLYDSSNKISLDQIQALNILHDQSTIDDIVYSHINGVSETYHDVIVSDRDIVYFTTKPSLCAVNDPRCRSFNSPQVRSSYDYFLHNHVKFFLFMKPSQEGNSTLDGLISQYASSEYYRSIFRTDRVAIFTLNNT